VRAIAYRLRHRLRSRWGSTVVLTVVVAVTGGIVLTLTAGAARTLSAPSRYRAWQGDLYDVSVQQESGRPRTAEIASLPAVARVAMGTFVFGGLKTADGLDVPDGLVFAGSPAAFGQRLVSGREPDPAAPGEFVGSREWIEAAHARLGDRFRLVTLTQAQADASGFDTMDPAGPVVEATMVGTSDGPSALQDGHSAVVFPATLLDTGDIGVSTTNGAVGLAPGATPAALRAQLDALPNGSAFGLDALELVPAEVKKAVSAQGQGFAILAAIVAITTLVVVGQLLSRQVRPAEDQRRALAALGMTRAQVSADPVALAAVPIVLGAAGAIALAYLASGLFPVGFVSHVEPHPGLRFDGLSLVGGAAVFAVLLVVWVTIGLRVARRTRRPAAPGLVDKFAPRLHSPEAAIGMRFAFTRPGGGSGARATVLGMVAVFGLLVGALTFGASVGAFIDHPPRWGVNFDASIGQGGGPPPPETQALIEDDPDVAGLTLFGTVLTSVGNDSFQVTGMQAVKGSVTPVMLSGRLPQSDDEIALGQVAAARFGVSSGDELRVVGPAGPRSLRVTGLVVMPSVESGDGVGEGGLVTFPALQKVDDSAALSTAAIRFAPGAPAGAAGRLSERIHMAVGPSEPPGVIINVDRIRYIPFVVAATLALLAVLALAHQLILSAERRRRDVAVLRALGANRRWVTGVVHWQANLFTVVVLALAVPVGIVAGVIVFRAFVGHMGALDTVTVPWASLAFSLLALFVLVNLVAAASAWRARRRGPARQLAVE